MCPNGTTLSHNYILIAYERLEEKLREELKPAIYICVTSDMWIDDLRQLLYSH